MKVNHTSKMKAGAEQSRLRQGIDTATQRLASAPDNERGAIFTRSEVVDFILDLTGYTSSKNLQEYKLLEPSFGHGDFLLPIVNRLLESLSRQNKKPTFANIKDAVRGVELHRSSFSKTKKLIEAKLREAGMTPEDTRSTLDSWLIQGDFLLTEFQQTFTHIIGNPPYIRHEMVPTALMTEYRRKFSTIRGRADIYIPFIENSLLLLASDGVLGIICADRWTKNHYGTVLRQMIAEHFHLRTYVDMVGTDAFHSNVLAYPAIIVVANSKPGKTTVGNGADFGVDSLGKLTEEIKKGEGDIQVGIQPWIFESKEKVKTIRRIESALPKIEEVGCKIGIGVATGADKIFITSEPKPDIEKDRLVPLITRKDTRKGNINWNPKWVINPFDEVGDLIPLEEYPGLQDYFETHKTILCKRHTAKKSPERWYRTIDRIHTNLTTQAKLLIPDIQGETEVIYEKGEYYPHHNFYYILSSEWDLHALQNVLLSKVTRTFVEAYSVRMHGQCVRFQAQYLKRIRIPQWQDVPKSLRAKLSKDLSTDDREILVRNLYSLSDSEYNALTN